MKLIFNKRSLTKSYIPWLSILGLILFNSFPSFSQCTLDVDAGPDQTECLVPAIFQLNGSVGASALSYEWSPATGLSDPNVLDPLATVTASTTYTLSVAGIDFSGDVILNGDFSNGNADFTSDYTYNASPSFPGNELVEGQYSIGTDPAPMHVNWVTCGDHTTGTGNMMLVNGSEFAGQNAWCQSVNVTANTDYAFSAWVTSVDPNGPCEIQFNINGSPIGAGNVGLTTTCEWINFFVFWNSGASTTAEICIEDVNIAEFGNDFAIDDIVFAPTCTDSDEVTLTSVVVAAQADSDEFVCAGETITLSASGGETYDWYGPFGYIGSGTPFFVFDATFLNQGIYTVEVTDEFGCMGEATTSVIVQDPLEVFLIEYTCEPSEVAITEENHLAQNGCDSIVYTSIQLAPTDVIEIVATTCDTSAAGVFVEELTNQYGCDSTVTTTIALNPSDSTYILETVCDSMAVDMIIQNLLNQYGCDSTVVIEKVFSAVDSTFFIDYACDLSLAGIQIDSFLNVFECDSVVFTEIIFIVSDSIYLEDYTCEISGAGVFEELEVNAYGCDSIIFTEVIFVSPDSTYLQDYTCDLQQSGVFEELEVNAYGCDSIIFTEVIFVSPDSTYLEDYTCNLQQSGIFEVIEFNSFGCDSIIFTEVIFVSPDSTYLEDHTCDLQQAGVFEDIQFNSMGCDSIIFTEVIYISPDSTYVEEFTCDTLEVGVFEDIQFNDMGCDSVIFTEILLLPSYSTIVMDYTCDSTLVGADIQDLISIDGCDSMVTTIINLLPQDTIYLNYESCDESEVGMSSEVLENQFGCDSLVITEITYFSDLMLGFIVSQPDCFITDQGSITADANGGATPYTYSVNGSDFQEIPLFDNLPSGEYQVTVQDANGCQQMETIIINAITVVSVNLGDDFVINVGDEAIINAVLNIPYDSLVSIEWTALEDSGCPTCVEQIVQPIITTTYSVEVVDVNGCVSSDALTISVELDKSVYVPNVITSNGDQLNDVLVIFAAKGTILNIHNFSGYSRWGNRIWNYDNIQPNDDEFGWDGQYKGVYVNSGVYVWVAKVEFTDGSIEVLSGDVTVVR